VDKFSTIVRQIAAQGWAVSQEFLPAEDLAGLAREAKALWASGKLKEAGVGRGAGLSIRPDIRGDYIAWLEPADLTPIETRYWAEMEKLRLELNRELFVGLRELEAHYAVYPPGAGYRKHLDRFATSDERAISCTLYLNPAWRREDGGALSIYLHEDDPEAMAEIYPQAGTFVAFRSDTIYHEVSPAARDRFSLTGWFRRRPWR
jgi:SM-20-related protein